MGAGDEAPRKIYLSIKSFDSNSGGGGGGGGRYFFLNFCLIFV